MNNNSFTEGYTKPLTGILVQSSFHKPFLTTIEDSLEEFYRILNCRLIDVAHLKFGDKYYDVVCDDEGLLKGWNVPSAYDKDMNPLLVGNLFVCKSNMEGEFVSLDDEDVKLIMAHTATFVNLENNFFRSVLFGVSY